MSNAPIGFFDSGSGGLSVLRVAREMMPDESFIYLGDNKNSPYGTKSADEILQFSESAALFLINKGVKAILIACNTATSVAVGYLRKKYDLPIFSMEPAIKPALKLQKNGKIAIMATPLTLKQERFLSLVYSLTDKTQVLPIPCPGLVELLDRGNFDDEIVTKYLDDLLSGINNEKIDVVVLGCTHYVFISGQIRQAFERIGLSPEIADGNSGTCLHLKNTLELLGMKNQSGQPGEIQFFTSADESVYLPVFRRLLARA